jgi:hypothetical protein
MGIMASRTTKSAAGAAAIRAGGGKSDGRVSTGVEAAWAAVAHRPAIISDRESHDQRAIVPTAQDVRL